MNAASTTVPDALPGHGVDAALLVAVILEAKDNGHKLTPIGLCVKARHSRHPDWAEVVAL